MELLDWASPSSVEGLLSVDQIFNTSDAALLANLAEDFRYERKSNRSDSRLLGECLSAFGNSAVGMGGVVAVGIDDDGNIEGCATLPGDRLAEIERFGDNVCPSGKFETRRLHTVNQNGQEDFIVLVRVYYVEDRLVELSNGEAYIRHTNRNHRLQDEEKREIRINKGEISFEQQKCGLSYPDSFKAAEISRFIAKLRTTQNMSAETSDFQILEMYKLGKREAGGFVPNNACAILFAKDPTELFPGCRIHFLRYEGEDEKSGSEFNVVKDRMIPGTIFDQISGISSILDASFREFTILDDNGKFFTVQEYPRDAWYELIVNACVHRSYNVRNAPIFVKMFDDKLVVESPGGFMPQVTPETIYEMHRPRNPFIMHVLREYGEVRCINEGTKRVRKEMANAKLPAPIFKQVDSSQVAFRATLQNDIKHRKNSLDTEAYKMLGETISFGLKPEEKKIINYVIENKKIHAAEALRILDTTRWHTAKKLLDELVERGALEFHPGKRPRDNSAHYTLRERRPDEKK